MKCPNCGQAGEPGQMYRTRRLGSEIKCPNCDKWTPWKWWGVEEESPDLVGQPAHYRHLPKEAIDIIHHVLGNEGFVAYCNGSILKYRLRVGHKDEVQQEMGKIREYERFRRNVEQGRGPREDD